MNSSNKIDKISIVKNIDTESSEWRIYEAGIK